MNWTVAGEYQLAINKLQELLVCQPCSVELSLPAEWDNSALRDSSFTGLMNTVVGASWEISTFKPVSGELQKSEE